MVDIVFVDVIYGSILIFCFGFTAYALGEMYLKRRLRRSERGK